MANHWSLPTLAGSAQAATIDDWGTSLISAIDNMTKFQTGTVASRPAAASSNAGLFYLATDTGVTYLSDGTAWSDLSRGVVPIGGLIEWPGSGEPTDTRFFLADGRSLLRATYPDCFTALGGAGSPWGLPDGTHFNLPDFRGRVSVSPDNMGTAQGAASRLTANKTIAAAAGEEKHTMTLAEMVLHNHAPPSGGTFAINNGNATLAQGGTGPGHAPNGADAATTGNAGSTTPFNVMQPFAVASKIIRVL